MTNMLVAYILRNYLLFPPFKVIFKIALASIGYVISIAKAGCLKRRRGKFKISVFICLCLHNLKIDAWNIDEQTKKTFIRISRTNNKWIFFSLYYSLVTFLSIVTKIFFSSIIRCQYEFLISYRPRGEAWPRFDSLWLCHYIICCCVRANIPSSSVFFPTGGIGQLDNLACSEQTFFFL